MLKRLQGKKGFTLIELIIVVVILGILILIVLAATRGDKDKANDAKIKSNAARVQQALEDCFDSRTPNAYPADMAAITASGSCEAGKFDTAIDTNGLTYTLSGSSYTLHWVTSKESGDLKSKQ